jgi:RNA polymerase sigma-32 factor
MEDFHPALSASFRSCPPHPAAGGKILVYHRLFRVPADGPRTRFRATLGRNRGRATSATRFVVNQTADRRVFFMQAHNRRDDFRRFDQGDQMALDYSGERSLSRKAMKAELLDAETELRLAYAWRDQRDEAALHRLITAYMRLAISMASKFKRYGAPMNDLIQEAGLGLMKAADKFDPDRGVRFSTYAVWWIKASIQDYVMRNWSMVRTGSTSSQKSLFFNMRRVQARLEREAAANGETLDRHQLHQMISTEIGVPLHDVEMMEGRLSGSDYSLNATQSVEDEGREWIDALEDDSAQAAEKVEDSHDTAQLREWLLSAMAALNDRERFIVRERKLRDAPRTLESLGNELGLSKERVRQLEAAAFQKMRKNLESQSREVQHFLV